MWPEGLSKMNFLTESNLPFRASQRLSAINVSEILKISGLTSEMKRQGRDVIDLSVGAVDVGEIAALAIWMSWKCALSGLPYGGERAE
jgi:hypothetical protein